MLHDHEILMGTQKNHRLCGQQSSKKFCLEFVCTYCEKPCIFLLWFAMRICEKLINVCSVCVIWILEYGAKMFDNNLEWCTLFKLIFIQSIICMFSLWMLIDLVNIGDIIVVVIRCMKSKPLFF